MKLMTHNLLMCNRKACTINNYPLKIECTKKINQQFSFDPELIVRFLKKIDLVALTDACKNMDVYKFDFQSVSYEELTSEHNLQYLNHVLFEVGIEEGALICNNCNRTYPITNGVANLVLNDDEI